MCAVLARNAGIMPGEKKRENMAEVKKAGTAKKGAASKEDTSGLIVHIVDMSEVDWKSFKNSRSGNWHEDEAKPEEGKKPIVLEDNDFTGLVSSIEMRGQDEPVTLRPYKGKLQLIAGFRRYAALRKLGHKTIKAFIRELNDNEARALNVRENTARNNLSGPDLAWAIWELYKGYATSGASVTALALSQEIGRNQAYVNTLLNIMRDVDSAVTDHWRAQKKPLPWKKMVELTKKPYMSLPTEQRAAKQREDYQAAVTAQSPPPPDPNVDHKLEALKKKAKEAGGYLGDLAREKVIEVKIEWMRDIFKLVKLPTDGLKNSDQRAVANAAKEGYNERLNYVAPVVVEEPPPAATAAKKEPSKPNHDKPVAPAKKEPSKPKHDKPVRATSASK